MRSDTEHRLHLVIQILGLPVIAGQRLLHITNNAEKHSVPHCEIVMQ